MVYKVAYLADHFFLTRRRICLLRTKRSRLLRENRLAQTDYGRWRTGELSEVVQAFHLHCVEGQRV